MICSCGHFPVKKILPKESCLSNRLHAQGFQYPFLGDLVGDMSTLFQRNGANNRIHCVSHDEFESGASKVLGL